MARQAMVVQEVTRSGLTPAYTAAHVDGFAIPNSGKEMIHVKTGGTGATVTFTTTQVIDGLAVADRAIVLGTSQDRMFGPFPPSIYNQADGTLWVDFSSTATVTIGAFRNSS
jgi:hypothetical protein